MLAYTLKVETRERKREKKRGKGQMMDGLAHTHHTPHTELQRKSAETLCGA